MRICRCLRENRKAVTTRGNCPCSRGHSGKGFLVDEAEILRAADTLEQKIRPAFGRQASRRLMVVMIVLPRLSRSQGGLS